VYILFSASSRAFSSSDGHIVDDSFGEGAPKQHPNQPKHFAKIPPSSSGSSVIVFVLSGKRFELYPDPPNSPPVPDPSLGEFLGPDEQDPQLIFF